MSVSNAMQYSVMKTQKSTYVSIIGALIYTELGSTMLIQEKILDNKIKNSSWHKIS